VYPPWHAPSPSCRVLTAACGHPVPHLLSLPLLAERFPAKGTSEAGGAAALGDLAALAASGGLDIPIARAYPLSEVKDAYRALADRHTRGKIVLHP